MFHRLTLIDFLIKILHLELNTCITKNSREQIKWLQNLSTRSKLQLLFSNQTSINQKLLQPMTSTLLIQQARTSPSSNNQLSQSFSNINSQNQNGANYQLLEENVYRKNSINSASSRQSMSEPGDPCISAELKNSNQTTVETGPPRSQMAPIIQTADSQIPSNPQDTPPPIQQEQNIPKKKIPPNPYGEIERKKRKSPEKKYCVHNNGEKKREYGNVNQPLRHQFEIGKKDKEVQILQVKLQPLAIFNIASLQDERNKSSLSQCLEPEGTKSLLQNLRKYPLLKELFRVKSRQQSYLILYELSKQYPSLKPEKLKKLLRKGKISLCTVNIDCNQIEKEQQLKKVYGTRTKEQRRRQIRDYLILKIKSDLDFIFIQEAHSKEIRKIIRQVVQTTQSNAGFMYNYPEHLDEDRDFNTTIILSKHNVRFGRMNCDLYNRHQAFCEFEIQVNGKFETVCLLNFHWKANQKNNMDGCAKIRKREMDCADDFRRVRQFYVMAACGDTNQLNDSVFEGDSKFVDTYDTEFENYRGTYLYCKFQPNSKPEPIEQRLDRFNVNRGGDKRISARTKIDKDYIFSEFKGREGEEKNILTRRQGQLNYISPSDHRALLCQFEIL